MDTKYMHVYRANIYPYACAIYAIFFFFKSVAYFRFIQTVNDGMMCVKLDLVPINGMTRV